VDVVAHSIYDRGATVSVGMRFLTFRILSLNDVSHSQSCSMDSRTLYLACTQRS
jgi:hypothetical protein